MTRQQAEKVREIAKLCTSTEVEYSRSNGCRVFPSVKEIDGCLMAQERLEREFGLYLAVIG